MIKSQEPPRWALIAAVAASLIGLGLGLSPGVLAGNLASLTPGEVRVGGKGDALTIQAVGVPLGTVLDELAKLWKVEIKTIRLNRQETVDVDLEEVSLQKALRKVLAGKSYLVSHDPAGKMVAVTVWGAGEEGKKSPPGIPSALPPSRKPGLPPGAASAGGQVVGVGGQTDEAPSAPEARDSKGSPPPKSPSGAVTRPPGIPQNQKPAASGRPASTLPPSSPDLTPND